MSASIVSLLKKRERKNSREPAWNSGAAQDDRTRIHRCQDEKACEGRPAYREFMHRGSGKGEFPLDLDERGGQPDFLGAYDDVERVHNSWIKFRPRKRDNSIHSELQIHR